MLHILLLGVTVSCAGDHQILSFRISRTVRDNMEAHNTRITWKSLVEAFSNLFLALMYLLFLYAFLVNYIEHHRVSSILFVLVESIFLYFSLTRRPPKELSISISAWTFAFAGTFLPLLLRPTTQDEAILGEVFQVAGVILIGLSILSLGRSFGIVAANRGIVTKGMYKYVRHPLYISYTVNLIGFLLNNFTAANAAVFVVALLAQLVRIQYEERLLLKDAAYRDYAQATKWRLVPYLY